MSHILIRLCKSCLKEMKDICIRSLILKKTSKQQNKTISGKNFDTTALTTDDIALHVIHITVNVTSTKCQSGWEQTKHKLNHCFCLYSLRLLPKLPAYHTLTYNKPRGPQL